jgi:hypothetical protein
MKKRLVALGAFTIATGAQAEDFGELRIGMSQTRAVAELDRYGKATVRPLNIKDGDTLAYNDRYNVTICRGRVIGITHSLQPTFATFTREVRVTAAERGGQGAWVSDSREGKPTISMVRVSWSATAPDRNYSIGYWEVDGAPLVSESLGSGRPCTP